MNKKNINPNPTQPVDRIPTGQFPSALAELSEDILVDSGSKILPNTMPPNPPPFIGLCSYDGDDAE